MGPEIDNSVSKSLGFETFANFLVLEKSFSFGIGKFGLEKNLGIGYGQNLVLFFSAWVRCAFSNVSKMLQSRFRRLLVVLIVLVGLLVGNYIFLIGAPTPLIANASFPCNSDDLEQNNGMG